MAMDTKRMRRPPRRNGPSSPSSNDRPHRHFNPAVDAAELAAEDAYIQKTKGGETMHLNELKGRKIADLVDLGHEMEIENVANLRRQELIFSLLQAHSAKEGAIFGQGVL